MGTLKPRDEDDLSEIEHRLAAWQPTAARSDADAMLFSAGLAAGRRGRGLFIWPALSLLLVALAFGLGVWGLSERAERIALAGRALERTTPPHLSPSPAVAVAARSPYTPSPDDSLHLRRQIEQDPSRWLASLQPAEPHAIGPPPPEPQMLRSHQRDGLLD
jgi:hypothetical protein